MLFAIRFRQRRHGRVGGIDLRPTYAKKKLSLQTFPGGLIFYDGPASLRPTVAKHLKGYKNKGYRYRADATTE